MFLDIDGVVSVPEFVVEGLWAPEPTRIERLNGVVRRTGCKVVLSSSWRITHGLEGTQKALARAGADFELFGATPKYAKKVGLLYVAGRREHEIQEWLDAHPEVEAFAIVDDIGDFGALNDHLVCTSFTAGLQDEHVERLVALLGEVLDAAAG